MNEHIFRTDSLNKSISNLRRTDLSRLSVRDRLIVRNYPLVLKVIKSFQNLGVPVEDLLNEGTIALANAADSFDTIKGTNFVYYAHSAIVRHLAVVVSQQGCTIRKPMNARLDARKLRQASELIHKKEQRDPTLTELAEFTGVSLETAVSATIDNRLVSLDKSSDDDSKSETIGDRIPTPVSNEYYDMDRILDWLKKNVSERSRLIFCAVVFEDRNMADVGRDFHLTRERVHQLCQKVRDKLKPVLHHFLM